MSRFARASLGVLSAVSKRETCQGCRAPYATVSSLRPAAAAASLHSTTPGARYASGTAQAGAAVAKQKKQEYETAEVRKQAYDWFNENGFDLDGLFEQPIVWGLQDALQHVNNVHTFRFFESARMHWVDLICQELPAEYAQAIRTGKGGVGIILASTSARYRRPVTWPDTLLIGHKVSKLDKDRMTFEMVAWSMQQRTHVTMGVAECVSYDYTTLKRADTPQPVQEALSKRMRTTS